MMRIKSNSAVFLFAVFTGLCFPSVAATNPDRTVLDVSAFGASSEAENNYEALQAAVKAASTVLCPCELRFESNAVYRIGLPDGPNMQGKYALHIRNATNLVLNGQGATLLVTHPETGAICTEDSSQVEVKNLNIDYDPLPYAQGQIREVNLEENWFELKVDDDFMEPDQPCFERAMAKWGLTVRKTPDGGRQYGPIALAVTRWEKTGEHLWRFHAVKSGEGYTQPLRRSGLHAGDSYVYLARNYAQAVAAKNCSQILWENIMVFSSPGLAFYPHRTSQHVIRNCHVRVKDGRIFSTNADGIHMRGSRGHALIEECSFEGMADDAINVHSSAMSIQGQPAPNQVLVKKHTFSVRPGDQLQMVHTATASRGATVTVQEAQDQGKNWLLTLDRPLPSLVAGSGFDTSDNFYNLSESSDPFTIRNCQFNDYRGRGIVISAHGGLVENNTFKVREGWGVVMNYESSRWAEGPIAYDIVIRSNQFFAASESRQPAILSKVYDVHSSGIPESLFQNICIEDNRFYHYPLSAIQLEHAAGARLSGNREISK